MDNPTWNDTLRASLSSCVQIPCLPWSSSGDSDMDTGNETRRARVANLGAAGYVRTQSLDEEDEAADAISLHSQLGGARNHARRRPPSRRLAFFGLNLFGTRMVNRVELPENWVDPLHRSSPTDNHNSGGGGSANRHDPRHTGTQAAGAQPTPGGEDCAAAVAEADAAKHARRRTRKELRRQREAAALAQSQLPSAEFEGVPGGYDLTSRPALPPSPHPLPSTPQQDQEEDDADADLDGGAYARLAPRGPASGSRSSGRSSGEGSGSTYSGFVPPAQKPKSKRTRTVGSRSSATSSTLASPPPSVTSFSHGLSHSSHPSGGKIHLFEEGGFDGTPGGFTQPFALAQAHKVHISNPDGEEFDGTQGF
ncbi:hypothetical protein C8R43DRAFT_1114287 [Mycena crocata]|nr:hypothetical protein C8R43DRAFT_1114287 [Mycena crocata]